MRQRLRISELLSQLNSRFAVSKSALRSALILPVVLLAACATPPFESAGANLNLMPQDVKQAGIHDGETVIWAGVILSTQNLADSTRLEVMAYPLDDSQSPDLDEDLLGRFMLVEQGYLEPMTYAEGRRISVLGKLAGTTTGKVGDSDYVYPLIKSEQLKLWEEGQPSRITFHFGLGMQL